MGLLKNKEPDVFQLILGVFMLLYIFTMVSALEAQTSEATTELACDIEAAGVTSTASEAWLLHTPQPHLLKFLKDCDFF